MLYDESSRYSLTTREGILSLQMQLLDRAEVMLGIRWSE